jgi:hypothetical protein
MVNIPYTDPPEIRRRFAEALADSADSKRPRLSRRDRAELRRIAGLWLATLPDTARKE